MSKTKNVVAGMMALAAMGAASPGGAMIAGGVGRRSHRNKFGPFARSARETARLAWREAGDISAPKPWARPHQRDSRKAQRRDR